MAALKYKDENGNYQTVVGVNMLNEVVLTTGNSTTSVMSQKAVSDLVPAQASSSNQLADKDFVNSSITTATATYQGSYNLVSDLSLTTQASHGQIEQALNTAATGADKNDYSFVQIPTSDSTPTEIASVERYKYNGTTWSYEYAINNSGFTAAQWAAVNSNITSGLVAQLNAFSNNPQTNISKLFGMDANGNFQNISTSDLASVLGVDSFATGFVSCGLANYGLAYDSYLDTGINTGLIIAADRSNDAYAQVWFIQGGTINQVANGGGSIGFDKSIELVNRNGTAQFHWRSANGNILTGFWIGMHY